MFLRYQRKGGDNFNEKMELRLDGESYHILLNNKEEVILEGKFYYYNCNNKESIFLKENTKNRLGSVIKKYNLDGFINSVEGEYCGIWIDKKVMSLKIFSDKLKHKEVYYFYNNEIFFASDNCKEIIEEINRTEIDENCLISSVLLYVPKGHTLFKNIYRLKYNETIKIQQDNISIERSIDRDTEIQDYSQQDFTQYEKIIMNSVLSRASDKLNLVFCSGGWDSTLLLAILRKNLGRNKVKGVIMKIIFPDGRCFNESEIYKVIKLCKSLDIAIDIIPVDNRKKESYRLFDLVSREIFLENLFYNFPTKWAKSATFINKNYDKDIVVFNGEGCDSLHNYGFAQYISIPHDDYGFREYADKMKSYLFGPSFFVEIKNNTFMNDAVYKIFLHFNQDKEFLATENTGLKKRIYYYLLSFVYSDVRIPFRRVSSEGYIKDSAFKRFEYWLEKQYFADTIANIQENNFYYHLSCLYTSFHLQSPQIRIFKKDLNNVRFSFIDLNLFKFLYKMPQEYGRGLNLNHIKFPLKELAKKILSESQIEIIKKGTHSYRSEIEEMNVNDQYLLKGSDSQYMKDKIDVNKVSKIFNHKAFVSDKIEKLLKNFKQANLKNISDIDARILLLSTLLSVNC